MNGQVLALDVPGVPVPQGSKRAFRHSVTGKVVMVDDNKNLEAWRHAVALRTRLAWRGRPPLDMPVWASLNFYVPRPAGHFGTGRNIDRLKESAPLWPAVKPDLDKLTRAVFDALTTARVWKDDAVCCGVTAWKFYADGGHDPGLSLSLAVMTEEKVGSDEH